MRPLFALVQLEPGARATGAARPTCGDAQGAVICSFVGQLSAPEQLDTKVFVTSEYIRLVAVR